jgi:uncharacterized OB-fold protein
MSKKIYSYSIVYSTTKDFADRTPYACAILEDEQGERVSCILDGYSEGVEIKIGAAVNETETDGKTVYSL